MKPPIEVLHLFPVLNGKLTSFLKTLTVDDWQRKTVARLWTVKDVVAHLVDGNYRQISVKRDGWTVTPDRPIHTYEMLVDYLNQYNADWVTAAKRLSPQLLIQMLEQTDNEVYKIYRQADPFGKALYSVGWAGESESYNWFDIAREYTESWHHHQQIREAMGDSGIMTKELYQPVLNIFIQAWPFAAVNKTADEGTVLKAIVTGDYGGEWFLQRSGEGWKLVEKTSASFASETIIDGTVAWKLFSKSVRKEDIQGQYSIKGNNELGETILNMVSVMA